jgi:hypothetical protein
MTTTTELPRGMYRQRQVQNQILEIVGLAVPTTSAVSGNALSPNRTRLCRRFAITSIARLLRARVPGVENWIRSEQRSVSHSHFLLYSVSMHGVPVVGARSRLSDRTPRYLWRTPCARCASTRRAPFVQPWLHRDSRHRSSCFAQEVCST